MDEEKKTPNVLRIQFLLLLLLNCFWSSSQRWESQLADRPGGPDGEPAGHLRVQGRQLFGTARESHAGKLDVGALQPPRDATRILEQPAGHSRQRHRQVFPLTGSLLSKPNPFAFSVSH